MRVHNVEIFLSRDTATGISTLNGQALFGLEDLPPYTLELHKFRDAHAADCFIAGIEACGAVNSMAHSRDAGTLASNCVVIVARLEQPRPHGTSLGEVLQLVTHKSSDLDRVAMASSQAVLIQRQGKEQKRVMEETSQVLQLLTHAGLEVDLDPRFSRFDGLLRLTVAKTSGIDISWETTTGPFKVSLQCSQMERESSTTFLAVRAAAHQNFKYNSGENEIVSHNVDASDLVQIILSMIDVTASIDADRKRFWFEQFCDGFKLTSKRRKFLEAAATVGVRVFYLRTDKNASAGGMTIKRTEILDLVRRGWLTEEAGGLEISDEGRKAIEA